MLRGWNGSRACRVHYRRWSDGGVIADEHSTVTLDELSLLVTSSVAELGWRNYVQGGGMREEPRRITDAASAYAADGPLHHSSIHPVPSDVMRQMSPPLEPAASHSQSFEGCKSFPCFSWFKSCGSQAPPRIWSKFILSHAVRAC